MKAIICYNDNMDYNRGIKATLQNTLEAVNLPDDFIAFILNENNNPAKHPYHNGIHCQRVAYHALMGAEFYNLVTFDKSYLVLAGIFHDWAHSGGWLDDRDNVTLAIGHFEYTVKKFKVKTNVQKVSSLIRATEYPHNMSFEIMHKIIQDADLMQYSAKDYQLWIDNYNEETKSAFTKEDVAGWLQSQHLNTDWANEIRIKTIANIMQN